MVGKTPDLFGNPSHFTWLQNRAVLPNKYKRVKGKHTYQSLRFSPRQCFFERKRHFSLNWLIVQILAKFVGAYREPEDQLTSLISTHYPCAAAGGRDGPCLLWQLSLGVVPGRPKSSPAVPKTTLQLRARQAGCPPHISESPDSFILEILIAGIIL